jgi:hypothetical protein
MRRVVALVWRRGFRPVARFAQARGVLTHPFWAPPTSADAKESSKRDETAQTPRGCAALLGESLAIGPLEAIVKTARARGERIRGERSSA